MLKRRRSDARASITESETGELKVIQATTRNHPRPQNERMYIHTSTGSDGGGIAANAAAAAARVLPSSGEGPLASGRGSAEGASPSAAAVAVRGGSSCLFSAPGHSRAAGGPGGVRVALRVEDVIWYVLIRCQVDFNPIFS